MIQRALISVSDKTGVVEFARELNGFGVELLSTGGTARALREAGLPVKDVSEFTGFPEMLDGRVKTLHPKVHAGLLHLRDDPGHLATMRQHHLEPIDLVCVNLYPFEATVARADVSFTEAIEQIDIGGPSMLRSAAKNMRSVTVVTDPSDYARVIESMREHGGDTTEPLRLELGRKVYARTAAYDAAIAAWLAAQAEDAAGAPLVRAWSGGVRLRYGENPHQAAVFYRDATAVEAGIAHTEQLHGKEMSYNNYLDGDAALESVKELVGAPGVSIIKHSNPCGYATGETLAEALEAAWAGDPVSAFGSVIAVTRPVDRAMAERLKGRFVEALIAPEFEPDALEFLKAKSKDLRLLRLGGPVTPPRPTPQLRQITGGMLVQDRDVGVNAHWTTVSSAAFPDALRPLAEFGVKVCKHVKSNAIVLVREYAPGRFQLIGMGAGQPNRVDSVRKLALARARENIERMHELCGGYGQTPEEFHHGIIRDTVLVSDAFFPFADNIEFAAEAGLRYIVEPGGSVRDEEVIAACDRFGIAMVFTGMRHFKH
ncbi:MAG: bifunctional phosphoribosylaminoimidazolecarboxamide formyltransferase/IMP cyclohydrolase [Kiritimatiellae bacterium]|nr:bifunctional phosphoribosylaminoimidazolecarboxamide formyltransferase/IMP cyclohydrolase [Kiritimatiellia bacterium]